MRAINAAHAALTAGLPPGGGAARLRRPPAAPATVRYSPSSAEPVGAAAWHGHVPIDASMPVGSTGAVAMGDSRYGATTLVGVFGLGALGALVAALAAWAFMVTRPFQAAEMHPPAVAEARVAPASSSQGTQAINRSIAAQASANAAANAAAARSNAASVGGMVASNPHPAFGHPLPRGEGLNGTAETSGSRLDSAGVQTVARAPEPVAAANHVPVATAIAPGEPVQPTGAQSTQAPPQAMAPLTLAPLSSVGHAGQQHNQSVSTRLAMEGTSLAASAARALSNYDRAWTAYAGALRGVVASGLVTQGSASTSVARAGGVTTASGGAGAAAFLSSEAQLTVARALHLQQQVVWNQQAAAVLASAPAEAARLDGVKAARAELRLRQAAELVMRAQDAGVPAPAAQVKALLDEAETLHREGVAEWAALLRTLG
jgi:hypothetical protein